MQPPDGGPHEPSKTSRAVVVAVVLNHYTRERSLVVFPLHELPKFFFFSSLGVVGVGQLFFNPHTGVMTTRPSPHGQLRASWKVRLINLSPRTGHRQLYEPWSLSLVVWGSVVGPWFRCWPVSSSPLPYFRPYANQRCDNISLFGDIHP